MKKNKPKSSFSNEQLTMIKKIKYAKILITTFIVTASIGYIIYGPYKMNEIYSSMNISFLSTRIVEYGTPEFDTRNVIENIENGVIKNYTKEIDTKVVGPTSLKFEIGNEDIKREFETSIEVIDTKKPIIEIKQQTITMYKNANYDVKNNIKRVYDEIDGDIEYKEQDDNSKINYYIITTNLDSSKTGEYEAIITAYDTNGNEETTSYKIKVIERPTPKVYTYQTNYVGTATVDTSSVVATAKSFIGYKYVRNGELPSTGFDCSGLVKYVYSLHGKTLGHGTTYQAAAGYGVSRNDMQPGDIILWSTLSNNYPTHAAIYIGDNQMVHAANPRVGVILSDVTFWETHGGGHIATIRRI